MPSLLGVPLTALFTGKRGLDELLRRLGRLRVPLVWYAVVLLLLPVLQLVALGIPALLGLATITLPSRASLSSVLSVQACLKSSAGEDSSCHDCRQPGKADLTVLLSHGDGKEPAGWRDLWRAGDSVSGIDLLVRLAEDYGEAR